MLWLIELPDLDTNVGTDVKVHMVAAIENICIWVITVLRQTQKASGGFFILISVFCKLC